MSAHEHNVPVILGATQPHAPDVRIKTYDFYRPDKFSKEQIRIMSMIHETFANLLGIMLSREIRGMAKVDVAEVDQLAYYEFVEEVADPCSFLVYGLAPLKGTALLHIGQEFTYALLDRVAGGSGIPDPSDREMSDLEKACISKLGRDLCEVFDKSWQLALPMKSFLGQVETMSKFAQIVPPTEMIIMIRFRAETPRGTAELKLVYPFLTLEPIIDRLSAKYWYSELVKKPGTVNPRIAENLDVTADIRVNTEPISLSRLKSLKPGDSLAVSGENLRNPAVFANGSPVLSANWADPRPDRPIILVPLEAAGGAVGEEDRGETGQNDLAKILEDRLSRLESTVGGEIRRLEGQLHTRPITANGVDAPYLESVPGAAEEFRDLTVDQGEYLHAVLSGEYPQIQALTLTQVGNTLAADYISRLDQDVRIDVLRRIAGISVSHEWVLKEISEYLKKRLSRTDRLDLAGGLEKTVEILNNVPAAVEREVILAWEQSDPEFCEEIKKRMFVFEDLVMLDARTVKKLYEQCAAEDFAISMKQTAAEVSAHLRGILGDEEMDTLAQLSAEIGAVRLKDVDAAKMRIVEVLRELDEAGQVVVARPGEMVE
jgi:flagellar motor switch protein FliM